LFDIPLFYSFLKDRNWEGLTNEEYDAISAADFPIMYFSEKEQQFLHKQKELLLKEYKEHLFNGNASI
jgi:hypothetical protein